MPDSRWALLGKIVRACKWRSRVLRNRLLAKQLFPKPCLAFTHTHTHTYKHMDYGRTHAYIYTDTQHASPNVRPATGQCGVNFFVFNSNSGSLSAVFFNLPHIPSAWLICSCQWFSGLPRMLLHIWSVWQYRLIHCEPCLSERERLGWNYDFTKQQQWRRLSIPLPKVLLSILIKALDAQIYLGLITKGPCGCMRMNVSTSNYMNVCIHVHLYACVHSFFTAQRDLW